MRVLVPADGGALTAGRVSRSVAAMTRIVLVLLIAGLAAAPVVSGLTGCGGGNIVIGVSPTPTSTATPTRTPTPTP